MPCYHPRYGYRAERGLIRLNPRSDGAWKGLITVACGQCVGCKAEQARQWGVRGMHEHQMSERSCFITLTYDPEDLPENGNLKKRDWQDFAKSLRHRCGSFRFLMCGEYGETATERCHFHAAIFGLDFFEDRKFYKTNKQGHSLFTSAELGMCWTKGFHTIGDVTFDSVNYVAAYVTKKINGREARAHYRKHNDKTGKFYDQVPEFALMSRGDNTKNVHTGYGLGHSWISKYYPEVYPRDQVLVNGTMAQPPVYYDRWYAERFPSEMEAIKKKRQLNSARFIDDNSPERLATKKKVFTARYAQYKRNKSWSPT